MVNTLVLSVFKRTRELGMLRTIGMTRRQARRVIRHESVITALIGAALGLPLGIFLAGLVTQALSQYDIAFSIPIPELVAFTTVAILAASRRRSCRPAAPPGSTFWTRCTSSDPCARNAGRPNLSSLIADDQGLPSSQITHSCVIQGPPGYDPMEPGALRRYLALQRGSEDIGCPRNSLRDAKLSPPLSPRRCTAARNIVICRDEEGERRDSNPRPPRPQPGAVQPATTRFWTGCNALSKPLTPRVGAFGSRRQAKFFA